MWGFWSPSIFSSSVGNSASQFPFGVVTFRQKESSLTEAMSEVGSTLVQVHPARSTRCEMLYYKKRMHGRCAGRPGRRPQLGGPIDGEWFRAVAEMEDSGWI